MINEEDGKGSKWEMGPCHYFTMNDFTPDNLHPMPMFSAMQGEDGEMVSPGEM